MTNNIWVAIILMVLAFLRSPAVAGDSAAFIRKTFPLMPKNEYRNIKVYVTPDEPQECPLRLENAFSNTNIFTSDEMRLLNEVVSTYQKISPESRITNAVFDGCFNRSPLFPYYTNKISVARFSFTNSTVLEQRGFLYGNHTVIVRRRNVDSDGYDVEISDGKASVFKQFKAGALDGLFVGFAKGDKVLSVGRFKSGQAIGNYYAWDDTGRLTIHLEFKKPLDLFKYQAQKTDMYEWSDD